MTEGTAEQVEDSTTEDWDTHFTTPGNIGVEQQTEAENENIMAIISKKQSMPGRF